MEEANQSDMWQLTKGLMFSQLVLVVTLINAGVTTVDDISKDLDEYIDLMIKSHPNKDLILFLEPIKALKEAISNLPNKDNTSIVNSPFWFSEDAGHA